MMDNMKRAAYLAGAGIASLATAAYDLLSFIPQAGNLAKSVKEGAAIKHENAYTFTFFSQSNGLADGDFFLLLMAFSNVSPLKVINPVAGKADANRAKIRHGLQGL